MDILTGIGIRLEDFSVTFSLSQVRGIENFVARDSEIEEIRKALSTYESRRIVVLQGLGGGGKTQLSFMYATTHKDSYSAIPAQHQR